MPRHPPCALNNLTTKMLASTVQFSNNHPRQPLTRDTSQTHDLSTYGDLTIHQGLRYDLKTVRDQDNTLASHQGRPRVFSQDPTVCRTPSGHPLNTSSTTSTPKGSLSVLGVFVGAEGASASSS